jgi:glycosyltransferase involved in cell wall biosynthesis
VRIAYVALIPASGETGVLKKIVFQLRAWRDAGHEVSLFTLGHGSTRWEGASDLDVRVYPAHGTLSWFQQAGHLADAVQKARPDVVYHRFNVHFPGLERLLATCPTVVELNTLDVPEYRESLSRLRFAYHLMTRGRLLRRARGLLAVTGEIARSVERFGRPTLVLANGIDLSAFEVAPPTTAERPSLVFIAAKPHDRWHGLDKLLLLARSLPQVNVHVIGCGQDALGAAPPNVTAHGFLEQARYQALLASADVGVGPLALHRKHMDEACPLKTREYLAMGLPVIAAYRDPDFPRGAPFVLELTNREQNIEPAIDALTEFVSRWHHHRVDRAQIAHLDTHDKERKRLAFMAEVCGRERRA